MGKIFRLFLDTPEEIAACILDDPNEALVNPGRSLPRERSMQVITHLLLSEVQAKARSKHPLVSGQAVHA
jgi:hypothetical protein